MIVKEIRSSDKFEEKHDYRNYLKIVVDNRVLEFCDGEPEDANLRRDFNDCYSIIDMMRLAYESGKRNEDFIIIEKEIDDWED